MVALKIVEHRLRLIGRIEAAYAQSPSPPSGTLPGPLGSDVPLVGKTFT